MSFRLPNNKQRITIVGATGSGKTQAGVWNLSLRDFDRMPWVIFDFKRDELIGRIPGARVILVTDSVPTKPGVYIVQPHPDDFLGVQDFMRRIWEHQDIGLYVDEGYMVSGPGRPVNPWFNSIITTGRSMRIPAIVLSQRPVFLGPFVFTESDFYQVFRLNYAKDVEKMEQYVKADLTQPLPKFHSYWYDVGENQTYVLKPVPPADEILDAFDTRMKREVEKRPRIIFV